MRFHFLSEKQFEKLKIHLVNFLIFGLKTDNFGWIAKNLYLGKIPVKWLALGLARERRIYLLECFQ